jgi:ribosomal protein S12 methylthiotransferase
MQKFYCISLGCSENALDDSLISAYLQSNDWERGDSPQDADLIIVNSCGFTAAAEWQSIQTYQHLKSVKRPEARVIFAGCLPAINKQAVRV